MFGQVELQPLQDALIQQIDRTISGNIGRFESILAQNTSIYE
jgi:hypothetical protein